MNLEGFNLGPEHKKERPIPCIEDLEEAREYIHDLYESGERPVVTVPQEYAEILSQGLAAQTTWISDLKIIAGTFGRPPYMPEGEERKIIEISDIPLESIQPRMTGKEKAFQGVVILRGPIKPEAMRVLT